jgi:hypothetical protein
MNDWNSFLERNNLVCVFMGTGLSYYAQYVGEDILYLQNADCCSTHLKYCETNNPYFNEYNNSKFILDKYELKVGDKLYSSRK